MTPLYKLYSDLNATLNISLQEVELNKNNSLNNCLWHNKIFFSPSIRYGHLEYFKGSNEKIEVVHCVLYPSFYKSLPIFGFDVISLNNNITGIFCDYTPCPFHNENLLEELRKTKSDLITYQRNLPAWATFFSPDFIAVDPKNEYEKIESACKDLLYKYLYICELSDFSDTFLLAGDVESHIEGQNNYSLNQRKNTKTQKALTNYIGEKEANSFIENVLFPTFRNKIS